MSLAGLAVCLAGAMAGALAWAPSVALYQKVAAVLAIFCGTALVAWVFGDSMRYRFSCDVMVMDARMPRLNGVEATRRIDALRRHGATCSISQAATT